MAETKRRTTKPGLGAIARGATPSTIPGREPPTGKRRRVSLREDHVGSGAYSSGTPAAVAETLRNTTPRVLHDARSIAGAPLSPREAFVLSFIDGQTRVSALVDITSMPEEELFGILHRLRRLGLVSDH